MGGDRFSSGDASAQGDRSRGRPHRRRHRRPVGETHRSGYDAGKKIKGGKRHIVTDTGGLPVAVMVHEADIRDRAGVPAGYARLDGDILSVAEPHLCRGRLWRRIMPAVNPLNRAKASGSRMQKAALQATPDCRAVLRSSPCCDSRRDRFAGLIYFMEVKPIMFPSVSRQSVTKPNSPIENFGRTTVPPDLATSSSCLAQSSTEK